MIIDRIEHQGFYTIEETTIEKIDDRYEVRREGTMLASPVYTIQEAVKIAENQ